MQGSSEKICDTRFLLRNIENRLLSYGNESARLDARCILGLVLGRDNPVLPHEDIDNLSEYQTQYLEEILSRRINGEPISRIRGWREFWSLRFSISPDTLDPRPDSEILVEAAYNWLSARYPDEQKMRARAPYCLDIGTGSGCLLLALISELPFVTGLGTDLSRNAIQLARQNALNLGLALRAKFKQHDFHDDFFGHTKFDLVLLNPPYIPTKEIDNLSREVRFFEPRLALDGGVDGLNCWRQILPKIVAILKPSSTVFAEIGNGQEEAVSEIARSANLSVFKRFNDLSGVVRCLQFVRKI